MQATLGIKKCFHGHQARNYFCELKNGVTTLQSCTVSKNISFNFSKPILFLTKTCD